MAATRSIALAGLRLSKRLGKLLTSQGVLLMLLSLAVFASFRYQTFLTPLNIMNVMRQNSMLAIVALGMTVVILSGGIDLSVGSLVALGGVVAAMLVGQGSFIAIACGIISTTLLGAVNGLLVSRARLQPFVVTLFTASAARGLALSITQERSIAVPSTASGLVWLGRGFIGFVPVPVLIVALLYFAAWLILQRSRLGLHIYAIGNNEEASRLMGVNPNQVKLAVYTFSGMLSGLAGVVLAGRLGAGQPVAAFGWETDAIAATVMGGTFLAGGQGSVFPTLIGVLLLGMMYNLLNLEGTITPWWQLVLRGGFLLLVVIFQQRIAQRK
ncbi:ABC transporter permease [Nostoc sp. FACHB-152]|uniref:ABC transporter permease n=1 Tax=unclassified Nostoc TaxID=2593658 RepID=UPI001683D65A|nr:MULTISPECIES: ABC transporter permease [unclassified Nostoc]MBD2450893.1 ABC transporter permease [Nostoc sp. FACHB-152]MBD2470070.1 ABC transporter permease [Nostoc sp. FACHB-145]